MSLSQLKSPLRCRSRYLLPPFHRFLHFESNPWSLSSWARCIVRLWGVIGHSIISHLPSRQARYRSCSALERRYAITDVFTWFRNVPACTRDAPSPVATSSLPVLLCHLSAYMYNSQNSNRNRQVDKLYLYFVGTESVLAIYLTFRQVIHLGKYTFRQVSLYVLIVTKAKFGCT